MSSFFILYFSLTKFSLLPHVNVYKEQLIHINKIPCTWTNCERRKLNMNWGNIENLGDKVKEDGASFWYSPNREHIWINDLSNHLMGSNSACKEHQKWIRKSVVVEPRKKTWQMSNTREKGKLLCTKCVNYNKLNKNASISHNDHQRSLQLYTLLENWYICQYLWQRFI